MSCPDCTTATGFPNTCGQVVVVNYRPPEASSAIPAWLEYNCDGGTHELVLYTTPDLEETIDDWDIDYIEVVGKGISGTSCADPVHADLCPPTLDAIHTMFLGQTTAINANIDVEIQSQTTAINANIDEAETAIVNAVETAGDEIEAAIGSAANSIVDSLTDAIAPINYAYAFTYTANGDVETITRTATVNGIPQCEVQTYSYDGTFALTGVSAWVPCP